MDLVEMRYTMTSTDQSLLTEAQAAELLGIRPQTLSVWRSTKRYPLPYIRVGRRIRYRRSACDAFLESRTAAPMATSRLLVTWPPCDDTFATATPARADDYVQPNSMSNARRTEQCVLIAHSHFEICQISIVASELN